MTWRVDFSRPSSQSRRLAPFIARRAVPLPLGAVTVVLIPVTPPRSPSDAADQVQRRLNLAGRFQPAVTAEPQRVVGRTRGVCISRGV